MKKGIVWAIKMGLNFRRLINENGARDIYLHIYPDGGTKVLSTYKKKEIIKEEFLEEEFFEKEESK